MSNIVRIALIGDYRPGIPAHVAIPRALELAVSNLGLKNTLSFVGSSRSWRMLRA